MANSNISDFKEKLISYCEKFRHPSLTKFGDTKIYDLFPRSKNGCLVSDEIHEAWPSKFPYADSPGVYAFLNDRGIVEYIGKANNLGKRLCSYTKYEKKGNTDSGCKLSSDWKVVPRYIAVVSVPKDSWFEILSLEGYLIEILNPPQNTQGTPILTV